MDYEELLTLITEQNDLESKKLFLQAVEEDRLWVAAFLNQPKKAVPFQPHQKEILDYTFVLLRRRVDARQVPPNTNLRRLIPRLIRMAVQAHRQQVEKPQALLTFLVELGCIKDYLENEFNNYVDGVNPFTNKMDEREVNVVSRWYKMLPPDCRKLLEYKYVQQLSHLQIAQREDVPVDNEAESRSRTYHCLGELRKKCFEEVLR